jgi:transcriptional regulator of acetoin/glycerol metabolism
VVGDLGESERLVIRRAIERCRGNLTQAARVLGIAKSTLYQRMKKYGLSRDGAAR